ncbi:M23 family metallopeptidase [Streptomyces bathyalis]|uniref:M23 family metallopeptidase n=1 Tax=Streptomyces bathyalis TaxID=2710756 RepID=A0A7T1WRC1_9ACTN|nr:M23 family metallopeptidase [Streptomyces bathyalis]
MVLGVAGVLRETVRLVACTALCAAFALVVGGVRSARAHAEEGRERPSMTTAGMRDAAARGADGSGGRAWPVEGRAGVPRVVRRWKPPPKPWAAGHRGVDLAAPRGSPVRAVAAGRVSFAGKVAGRGVVSVELSGTGRPPLRMTYEPVRPSVHKGERVRSGQTVGRVAAGPFHCDLGCLHWGARRGERYLDPLSLLRGGPSRLLPVFGVPLPGHAGRAAVTGGTTGTDSATGAKGETGSEMGTNADTNPGADAGTARRDRTTDGGHTQGVGRTAATVPAATAESGPALGAISLAAMLGCGAYWARGRLVHGNRSDRSGRCSHGRPASTERRGKAGRARHEFRGRPPPGVSGGRR